MMFKIFSFTLQVANCPHVQDPKFQGAEVPSSPSFMAEPPDNDAKVSTGSQPSEDGFSAKLKEKEFLW